MFAQKMFVLAEKSADSCEKKQFKLIFDRILLVFRYKNQNLRGSYNFKEMIDDH